MKKINNHIKLLINMDVLQKPVFWKIFHFLIKNNKNIKSNKVLIFLTKEITYRVLLKGKRNLKLIFQKIWIMVFIYNLINKYVISNFHKTL